MVGSLMLSNSNMAKFVAMLLLMLMLLLLLLLVAPNIGSVSSSEESFHPGRHLMHAGNGSEFVRQSDNTARVDPLKHLKKYRGGFDITNKHYWSSTAFTGIYGYAIAVAWAFCGMVYGLYLVVTSCCYKKKKNTQEFKNGSSSHKQFHLQPVFVAVALTILVIIGSGLVLGGTAKFHSRAKTVVNILINTADDASETIYNTTTTMDDMNRSLEAAHETGGITRFLTSTSKRLDDEAADISRKARKNRRAIYKGLKIVYIVTSVVISISLIAAIMTTVFGILKSRSLRLLIGICWIVIFFCWMFFGIYYFIYNFADDTCTALEGFQQDPYNNSLGSLLSCDELHSAKSVLSKVSAEIHNIVNKVNRNIEKSYGNIAQICNPFSPPPEYRYQPQECPANTIQIGDIPQLLKLVACPDYERSNCTGGIVIPSRKYNLVVSYSTSIQRLLNQYPHLERLVECQTVTDAFSDILHNQCKPLKRYARTVWAALAFLSVVMVALFLICVYEANYQQKHWSTDISVKPYSTVALESGVEKATTGHE